MSGTKTVINFVLSVLFVLGLGGIIFLYITDSKNENITIPVAQCNLNKISVSKETYPNDTKKVDKSSDKSKKTSTHSI